MEHNDADVIRSARDYIASGKWWKGSARNCGGDEEKVCAVTALRSAGLLFGLSDADADRITIFVERFAPPKRPSRGLRRLALYNDQPDTTLADITHVFDKALAELGGLA